MFFALGNFCKDQTFRSILKELFKEDDIKRIVMESEVG